ncbi:MAG TPA: hypothetical protein VHF07_07260 [Nitrospiraceae bacterium]|nr:hypothetical protein [Nitrospiraceae bacterium]
MFEGSFHCDPRTTQEEQKAGIIVLSMAGRVLHANRAARGVARLASGDHRMPGKDQMVFEVPPLVREFAERVTVHLKGRIEAGEWRQFELKEIMRAAGNVFLLRGFGLPDILRRQQSRILITVHFITTEFPS